MKYIVLTKSTETNQFCFVLGLEKKPNNLLLGNIRDLLNKKRYYNEDETVHLIGDIISEKNNINDDYSLIGYVWEYPTGIKFEVTGNK